LVFCLLALFRFAGVSGWLSCQFWQLWGALLALVFIAGIFLFFESSCVLFDGAVPVWQNFLSWPGARWCPGSVVALCRRRGAWPGAAWRQALPGQRASAAQGVGPSRPTLSV